MVAQGQSLRHVYFVADIDMRDRLLGFGQAAHNGFLLASERNHLDLLGRGRHRSGLCRWLRLWRGVGDWRGSLLLLQILLDIVTHDTTTGAGSLQLAQVD